MNVRFNNIRNSFPDVKPEVRDQYTSTVKELFQDRLRKVPGSAIRATLDADGLSNSLQELDDASARALRRGGDGYDLSEALGKAREAILTEYRANNPVNAARLDAADKAWSHYAELRRAGASTAAGNVEGQFSPTQLAQSSKAADISYGKTRSSEGTTRYGDYARQGIETGIGPMKGANLMAKVEGAGLAGGAGYANPWLWALAPAGKGYSTPEGQAIMHGYLNYGAPVLRGLGQTVMPRAGGAAALPANQEAIRRALLGGQQ